MQLFAFLILLNSLLLLGTRMILVFCLTPATIILMGIIFSLLTLVLIAVYAKCGIGVAKSYFRVILIISLVGMAIFRLYLFTMVVFETSSKFQGGYFLAVRRTFFSRDFLLRTVRREADSIGFPMTTEQISLVANENTTPESIREAVLHLKKMQEAERVVSWWDWGKDIVGYYITPEVITTVQTVALVVIATYCFIQISRLGYTTFAAWWWGNKGGGNPLSTPPNRPSWSESRGYGEGGGGGRVYVPFDRPGVILGPRGAAGASVGRHEFSVLLLEFKKVVAHLWDIDWYHRGLLKFLEEEVRLGYRATQKMRDNLEHVRPPILGYDPPTNINRNPPPPPLASVSAAPPGPNPVQTGIEFDPDQDEVESNFPPSHDEVD